MVHVPFFNIDLPEPRLRLILPEAFNIFVKGTARTVEAVELAVHQPFKDPEVVQHLDRVFAESVPREFDRVTKRLLEGKIQGEDQLSSEVEDASFDWYRRQLRTSVMGHSDEDPLEFSCRKLGLTGPSPQEVVQEEFYRDHAEAFSSKAPVAAVQSEQDRQMLLDALQAAYASEMAYAQQQAESLKALEQLRQQLRNEQGQSRAVVRNASAGVLLGVFLFKGALQLSRLLLQSRKPKGKGAAKKDVGRATQRGAPQQAAAASTPTAPSKAQAQPGHSESASVRKPRPGARKR